MDLSLLSIFGAGLLTLVTPCILPMLPVYLSLLMGASLDSAKSSGGRFRLVSASLLFVAGFSSVFTMLGLGASSVGAVLQHHRDILLIVGGALIVVFGLKYLGVIKIRFLERTVQMKELSTGSRALNAFLFGVVFALGWTPCVGPILGTVLTYTAATTTSPLGGALYLLTYSLGVGLPLLVLSLLADRLVPHLRKLNRHLPKFEKATGVLMLAVGLALVIPGAANVFASEAQDANTAHGVANGDAALDPPLGAPSDRPRLVEFYAKHCLVCERMKPRVEQLQQDCVRHGVEILTVDISDPRNANIAKKFDVRAVPTIKLFDREGRVSGQLYGERELAELRSAAAGLLDAVCAGEDGKTQFDDNVSKPSCDTAVLADNESGASVAPTTVECSQPN